MPKAKKDVGNQEKKRGRPPLGAEPRVKRYFNFGESLNTKLDDEHIRTKASMNAIVEAALKATIAPEMLTEDDREFLKKFASVEGTQGSDLGQIVEQAVARVMNERFASLQFTVPTTGDSVVVDLPERQREAIEHMAVGLGFGAATHLLRSMVIGALSNPEGAESFLFAGQREHAKTRAKRQIQEEDGKSETQLKAA